MQTVGTLKIESLSQITLDLGPRFFFLYNSAPIPTNINNYLRATFICFSYRKPKVEAGEMTRKWINP